MASILRLPPPGRAAQPSGRFGVLRSRNFATIWLAGLISNAGAQMQGVASVWLVLQFTNAPLALGLQGLCFALPMTLLPPFGGMLADRYDRVTVLKVTQTLQVIQPLLLAAILATGHLHLWMLYVDTLAAASIYAFNSPAQQALLPVLVAREYLLRATALNSAVWTAARLVGPALGGALLLPLGAAGLFAINGLTTLFVLAALFGLREVPRHTASEPKARTGYGATLLYVRQRPTMLAMLVLTAGLTLLQGAFMVLLPVFARDTWGAGPSGYGLLLSATGAGALIGTVGLASSGGVRQPAALIGGSVALIGGALLAFAHAPSFALGLALLVLVGVLYAITNSMLATLLQLATPERLRGRVMALRSIAFIGVGDFGSLLSSGIAQVAGPPVALTAVVLLLALPLIWPLRMLTGLKAEQAVD